MAKKNELAPFFSPWAPILSSDLYRLCQSVWACPAIALATAGLWLMTL